jgi:hypothetical protein
VQRHRAADVHGARGRFQNLKIPTGKSSYPVMGGAGTAVFVEQLRPDKPPIGWLLGTRNPDAVIAALKHLRDDDD